LIKVLISLTMKTLSPDWIVARNAVLVLVFFAAFHLRLYMERKQGTSFKYNGKWPPTNNSAFLFGNQAVDSAENL
jgi:sterol desaturase/sphingolipid hydroxylase (fatty acid hydroxylase superfamily)